MGERYFKMAEHHRSHEIPVASTQTFYYTLVGEYLVWFSLFLVLWMCFCPFLRLKRMPASALNWISNKIGLTEKIRFTTFLLLITGAAALTEFMFMQSRNKAFVECKAHGATFNNCETQRGLKWRAERNFWILLFNALCWLLVDRLSREIKKEETYSAFLDSKGLVTEFST